MILSNLSEELSLLEQRLPSLTLAEILCGVRNSSLQGCQFLLGVQSEIKD